MNHSKREKENRQCAAHQIRWYVCKLSIFSTLATAHQTRTHARTHARTHTNTHTHTHTDTQTHTQRVEMENRRALFQHQWRSYISSFASHPTSYWSLIVRTAYINLHILVHHTAAHQNTPGAFLTDVSFCLQWFLTILKEIWPACFLYN